MAYSFLVSNDDGRPRSLTLAVDDLGKAITTFEMDVVACRVALLILNDKTGRRIVDLYDASTGRIHTDGIGDGIIDSVFDYSLDFCEFFLNRTTPLSDKAIWSIMVHVRFTLAYILGMHDLCGSHILKRKGRTKSLTEFSHTGSSRDEFREVSHIVYDCTVMDGMELRNYSVDEILEMCGLEERCDGYYRTILSDVSGNGSNLLVDMGDAEVIPDGLGDVATSVDGTAKVPLMDLVRSLSGIMDSVPALRYHLDRDLTDMRNNRVFEDDALMGRVRVRDANMESSPMGIDSAYRDNERSAEEITRFVRILNCVMSGSEVDGRDSHTIILRFECRTLLRLLDPDLFGRRYVSPKVFFYECRPAMERYSRIIERVGDGSHTIRIRSNAADMAKCAWSYSNRQVSVRRDSGYLCFIERPVAIGQPDIQDPSAHSPLGGKNLPVFPFIIVTDDVHAFQLMSSLGSPSRKAIRQRVRIIAVIDPDWSGSCPSVTVNRDSDEIPRVIVRSPEDIFDVHTECAVPLSRKAAVRISDTLKGETRDSAFVRHMKALIAECCRAAIDSADRADASLGR